MHTAVMRTTSRRIVLSGAVVRSTALAAGLLFALAGCGAGGSGSSAGSGNETLVLVTHSLASNAEFQATASGVFAASGSLVRVGASMDQSRAVFPHGSFLVTHPHGQARVTGQSVNHSTCVGTETVRAPYTISEGTGRYKGISGAGIAIVTFTARLPRLKNGACDMSSTATPVTGTALTTIRGAGQIKLA
jgi:hypothetical protein